MKNFTKHNSNKGRLLFSTEQNEKGRYVEIYEYLSIQEELLQYEHRTDEPLHFIKELMKYKSREEQFFASENFKNLIDTLYEIHQRTEHEKEQKDT